MPLHGGRMTRLRLVSLCLVVLVCLSAAPPATAAGPLVVPSGLTETVADVFDTLDRLLSWMFGEAPSVGPYIVQAG